MPVTHYGTRAMHLISKVYIGYSIVLALARLRADRAGEECRDSRPSQRPGLCILPKEGSRAKPNHPSERSLTATHQLHTLTRIPPFT